MARPKFDEMKAMVIYRKKDDAGWKPILDKSGKRPKHFDSRLDVPEAIEKLGIEDEFEYQIWLKHEHMIAKPKVTFEFVKAEDIEPEQEEQEEEVNKDIEEESLDGEELDSKDIIDDADLLD